MNKRMLLATVFAAIAPLAQAAGDHSHAAQHGGIVAAGKEADYELVAKPDAVQLYVYDHGKPMDVSKASARLTLLNGSDKQDVALAPTGGKLEAKGAFKLQPGTKAVAVVSNGGRTLGTARFTLK